MLANALLPARLAARAGALSPICLPVLTGGVSSAGTQSRPAEFAERQALAGRGVPSQVGRFVLGSARSSGRSMSPLLPVRLVPRGAAVVSDGLTVWTVLVNLDRKPRACPSPSPHVCGSKLRVIDRLGFSSSEDAAS